MIDRVFAYTEVADWKKRTPGASSMSAMYVMVYNSAATLQPPVPGCTFEDGLGRTMMFVRTDDFMNW